MAQIVPSVRQLLRSAWSDNDIKQYNLAMFIPPQRASLLDSNYVPERVRHFSTPRIVDEGFLELFEEHKALSAETKSAVARSEFKFSNARLFGVPDWSFGGRNVQMANSLVSANRITVGKHLDKFNEEKDTNELVEAYYRLVNLMQRFTFLLVFIPIWNGWSGNRLNQVAAVIELARRAWVVTEANIRSKFVDSVSKDLKAMYARWQRRGAEIPRKPFDDAAQRIFEVCVAAWSQFDKDALKLQSYNIDLRGEERNMDGKEFWGAVARPLRNTISKRLAYLRYYIL